MKIRLSAGALCIGCLTALVLTGHGKPTPEIKWDRADLGPFHTGTFKVKEQIVAKGIAIKVGDGAEQAAILFDPELIRMSAAWTGGFIIFPRGRGGLEGQAVRVGHGAKPDYP